MPAPIQVVIAEYDPEWPRAAARHVARLQALGPWVTAVHHIGSTSVPGLAAKPIIDLMPLVTDLAILDINRLRIEALSYELRGEFGIPQRRYCTLSDASGSRIAQLHFFKAESPEAQRHLAFRDYLRAHEDVARAYEAEKRRARDLHPHDSHAYTEAKAAWIGATQEKALAWFSSQPQRPNAF